MDYSKLQFKEKYIGKTLADNNKSFELQNDLPEGEKRYIYNMITKEVFDIFIEEVPKSVLKEVEVNTALLNMLENIEADHLKDVAAKTPAPTKPRPKRKKAPATPKGK